MFYSKEVRRELPSEYAAFREVDSLWRSLIQKITENSLVTNVTRLEGLLDTLKKCQLSLESIDKAMSGYLDEKRRYFPRFFFLSNGELISVLKETKDFTKVQFHLSKFFSGVKQLKYEGETIQGLLSIENEVLVLRTPIDVRTAEGAVEKWVAELEQNMLQSVHESIKDTSTALQTASLASLTEKHIGQALQVASLIH